MTIQSYIEVEMKKKGHQTQRRLKIKGSWVHMYRTLTSVLHKEKRKNKYHFGLCSTIIIKGVKNFFKVTLSKWRITITIN